MAKGLLFVEDVSRNFSISRRKVTELTKHNGRYVEEIIVSLQTERKGFNHGIIEE